MQRRAECLLPSIVDPTVRAQLAHDARELIAVWNDPPQELIDHGTEVGLSLAKARNNATKLWRKMLKVAAIRREFLPVLEAAKRAAASAKGDIAVRAVWNACMLKLLAESEDERNIIVILESLRRANGHDSTTVKHERALPDMDTVKKWKQEMIEAGITDFERIDLDPVKQIEAVVVERSGSEPANH